MRRPSLINFLPSLLVFPVWLVIAIREEILSTSFQTFYPLSIAMVFGSLIAGSTPLGGGVVAFPVSVLFIGFTPSQGRDFSLMIQSVGMSGASYLVLSQTKKRESLAPHRDLIAASCFFSLLGLINGFYISVSPYLVNVAYTTSVSAFAIILAYFDENLTRAFLQKEPRGEIEPHDHEQTNVPTNSLTNGVEQQTMFDVTKSHDELNRTEKENDEVESANDPSSIVSNETVHLPCYISFKGVILPLAIFSFIGGIISSQIGTGADIAFYVYGSMIHNHNTQMKYIIHENDLTASSILIMACTSVFGTILRVSNKKSVEDRVDNQVYQALIACSCIVILGAPLGSLFLTKTWQHRLKLLFYILSFLQLASFGILKVKDDVRTWVVIVGILSLVCVSILCFNKIMRRRMHHLNDTHRSV